MGIQIQENLTKANGFLNAGRPEEAKQLLQIAAETALDSKEILFALNCCHFMINSIRQAESAEETGKSGVEGLGAGGSCSRSPQQDWHLQRQCLCHLATGRSWEGR